MKPTQPWIGYGPWYVALLFNLNPTGANKKQTELRLHSKVDVIANVRNAQSVSDIWVTMMIVGPFYKYTCALTFFRLWSRQTRGKARRLKRAVTLLKHYYKEYNLCLWVQQKTYEEMKARVLKQRELQNTYTENHLKQLKKEKEEREIEMWHNKEITLKKLKSILK